MPIRRDMKLGMPMRPCQACGKALAPDECWGHVFSECPALLTHPPAGGLRPMEQEPTGHVQGLRHARNPETQQGFGDPRQQAHDNLA
eukprot:7225327-Pyramimonas_sp.AAC.1